MSLIWVFLGFSSLSWDREGIPKKLCDKDFAELSGELSCAICLKTLVLQGKCPRLVQKFFGAVRAIFWLWGSFLALDLCIFRLLWPKFGSWSLMI